MITGSGKPARAGRRGSPATRQNNSRKKIKFNSGPSFGFVKARMG
jgi:hypothetical protein